MSDMDGLCDVKDCRGLPLLGWRPLTERIGQKICEYHWRQHRDKQDSFDLFESFGFRRPPQAPKPVPAAKAGCGCGRQHNDVLHCRACGGPRLPGHSYCQKCNQSRQRQANQQRQRRHRMKCSPGSAVA